MENLDKEELLNFIKAYNNYVINFMEEHDFGMCPISIYEFYDNEYQILKEEKIYNMLDCIKNNIEMDFDIFTSIKEYQNYVKLGRNKKERLQILIMCYVYKPTIKELNYWSLNDLLEYIRETDDIDFYEDDMIEIKKCIDLIDEMEN